MAAVPLQWLETLLILTEESEGRSGDPY